LKKSHWPYRFSFICIANIIVASFVMMQLLEIQIVAMAILSLSRLALFSYHHAYIIEKFGMEYFGTLNGISSLIAAFIGILTYPLQLAALRPGFAVSFVPILIAIILSASFPFLLSRRPVKNWAESYAIDPRKFRRPESIKELIDLVKSETKIRCAGAMHSCAPLIESDGIVVSLEKLDKILEVNIETKIARFQAGVVIHELCEAIKPHGLALGTLGTIDWQTVVGAVMTGTHGGSLSTPSLHTFAESYTFITADGKTQKLTRKTDPTLFSAMAPSMGVFGVVIEMEMRLVPLQRLAAQMISMSFDDLIPQFQDIMCSNKYARVVVYPSINKATVWTAEIVSSDSAKVDGSNKVESYINFRDENEKAMLQQFLYDTKHGRYGKADDNLKKVLKSQLKRLSYYEGQYNHILCKERNHGIPHADMEFGFDFNKAHEVLKAVKGYCDNYRIPYYNFEVRTTMKDDAILSCCYERDTMWIDFQAKANESGEYFGAMEDLLEPIGYRKHWAKGMDHTNPDYIVRQYPRLEDFIKLMSKLDPHGKFRNKHTNLWFDQMKDSLHKNTFLQGS
jgi:L-gulonolactone oxidase